MVNTSAGVQTDQSKVVHTSCKSICHSSKPQTSTVRVSSPRQKCLGLRCSKHKLDRSHCLCLPSNGSPSQGDPKNQNSPRLARDALVLGPSAALIRDPTATSSVNNSSQTVPQLCVSHQSTTTQPPRLVSRSGQLQQQGFSVEVAERIAASQRSSTRNTSYLQVKVDAIWEMVQRKFGFFLQSLCETRLFHVPVPRSKQAPLNNGYRMAIVDTLGPTG